MNLSLSIPAFGPKSHSRLGIEMVGMIHSRHCCRATGAAIGTGERDWSAEPIGREPATIPYHGGRGFEGAGCVHIRCWDETPLTPCKRSHEGRYSMALRHANTTANRRALRAALATLNHVPSVLSATGRFSMTANREANLEPTIQIVRNGRFVHFP
jgi:hypothetical protein